MLKRKKKKKEKKEKKNPGNSRATLYMAPIPVGLCASYVPTTKKSKQKKKKEKREHFSVSKINRLMRTSNQEHSVLRSNILGEDT
jgi:hypothetical protein